MSCPVNCISAKFLIITASARIQIKSQTDLHRNLDKCTGDIIIYSAQVCANTELLFTRSLPRHRVSNPGTGNLQLSMLITRPKRQSHCSHNPLFSPTGIPSHVDRHSPFGDTILSLSLGSPVVMEWRHHSGKYVPLVVPARSLLVMQGEAR